jgi:stress response protein YsnF
VTEEVQLREERVHVERRPVNRPVTDADNAFREGTLEVTERAEEPVVAKTARVVEEVVVGKQVEEHTETIRDTVRRTDVDVQEVNSNESTRTDRDR